MIEGVVLAVLRWLDKERTVARPSFNRWLVPPCALAIHLCIGMAYGFSVFWLPLSRAVGITRAIDCPSGAGLMDQLFATGCDWKISLLGWMYSLFFVFLGLSAAVWGGWVERAGPRKAGLVATCCWCGGLLISALGIQTHQILLLWLGSGVMGGIGLGLGFIMPVSTLVTWFPDKRGMATGLAIMGFGGGGMLGAPLADRLMNHFATPNSVGVMETFLALAAIYFVFMLGGTLGYRIPAKNWKPAKWTPPAKPRHASLTDAHIPLAVACRTRQFWLIWAVLCLNITAGIGLIGMASPMLQEVFGGRLLGIDVGFDELTLAQKGSIATVAAGFTGLLSMFNMGGRFFWAALSDRIGRKTTFYVFFALGYALYTTLPLMSRAGNLALFVASFCVILSMYGGGFATAPAYLADMFGSRFVGAIYGRLLTAVSVAGVLGPVLVNYIREYALARGMAPVRAFNVTMCILSAMLILGFLCNWLVRAVPGEHHVSEDEPAADRSLSVSARHPHASRALVMATQYGHSWTIVLAWTAVSLPLCWGTWVTVQKALLLFG